MGLLSKITEGEFNNSPSISSKSEGLLAKMEKMQKASNLTFFDFLKINEITKCAVLSLCNGSYIITRSYNLDFTSIISAKSTADFWNGTLVEEEKWESFYTLDKSINSLLQLFSQDIKDTVSEINAIKIENSILLILKEDDVSLELESILGDFKNLENELTLFPVSTEENSTGEHISVNVDFSAQLDQVFGQCQDELYSEDIEINLKNELSLFIKKLFPTLADISFQNTILTFTFSTKTKVPTALLSKHLEKAFISWNIKKESISF